MIAIVQPAPFSSCLGFDGPCSAGRVHWASMVLSRGLGTPAWRSTSDPAPPLYKYIRSPIETDDIPQ